MVPMSSDNFIAHQAMRLSPLRSLWFSSPGPDGIGATLTPGFSDWREVLAISSPSDDNTQQASGDDVERMMACVHDAGYCDESSAKRWDKDDEGLPNFAFVVEDVQFCGKIDGEVEKACEGGWYN